MFYDVLTANFSSLKSFSAFITGQYLDKKWSLGDEIGKCLWVRSQTQDTRSAMAIYVNELSTRLSAATVIPDLTWSFRYTAIKIHFISQWKALGLGPVRFSPSKEL